MLLMAKKKPASKVAEDTDSVRSREGSNLNVWLPSPLMDAFEAMRKQTRRTKTAEAEVMFEEYLTKHGYWPAQVPKEA